MVDRVIVENVSFSYDEGKSALHDISFKVSPGEIFALFGPNSSGKTTLLRCISGLLKPSAGKIYIDGLSLTGMAMAERARRVAVVHQIHQSTFPYNVETMVLMGRTPHLGFLGTPDPEALAVARKAIADMGITHLAHRHINRLSGGERQLVLIARSLAQETGLLLLDEPTTYLDFRNQNQVLQQVRGLVEKRDLAVIITLHDPNLVIQHAHRVLLMQEGQVVGIGSPRDQLRRETLEKIYHLPVEEVISGNHYFLVPREGCCHDHEH
ncbi:MAG: ABC transporter ATP-binding protein [Bacillota bacterium]|nr:ABC transporter ATP-binding protein [Bacillota bacterium]MDW7729502.1 ABC transporter ATP-binding protein [Bacillota bacterium]